MAVLANVRTLLTAFARRHLRAESAMEPFLRGAFVPTPLITRSR